MDDQTEDITMPLLAAVTVSGGVFIAGQSPTYGSCEQEITWKTAFDAEGESEVNAVFDNGDHVIVEILTDMGLDEKEMQIGAKMVSVIRIPMAQIAFVKAGYLKGIPAPAGEDSTE